MATAASRTPACPTYQAVDSRIRRRSRATRLVGVEANSHHHSGMLTVSLRVTSIPVDGTTPQRSWEASTSRTSTALVSLREQFGVMTTVRWRRRAKPRPATVVGCCCFGTRKRARRREIGPRGHAALVMKYGAGTSDFGTCSKSLADYSLPSIGHGPRPASSARGFGELRGEVRHHL